MNSPFKENESSSTYTSLILSQIRIPINDSVKVDILGRSERTFRMTVQYIAQKYNEQYKTKKDSEGNMWVKRIA